jgi:hypothetical protein
MSSGMTSLDRFEGVAPHDPSGGVVLLFTTPRGEAKSVPISNRDAERIVAHLGSLLECPIDDPQRPKMRGHTSEECARDKVGAPGAGPV